MYYNFHQLTIDNLTDPLVSSMPNRRPILPRHLSAELQDALTHARVVNVVGARQAGKTTLVRDILRAGRFITLDDDTVLDAIEDDAWGQLQRLTADAKTAPLIIDEAQRARKLPLAIKRIVDTSNRHGQFVLTGSSNMFRTQHVADSLAGRMLTLTLWPMTVAETMSRGPSTLLDWALSPSQAWEELPSAEPLTRADYIELILKGGFPNIRRLELGRRQKTYRDYINSIVERDVADVAPIRKPDALRRLIDQLAVRTSMELNIAEQCEAVGLQRATVEQYLDVLMRLFVICRLGAWTSGEARREIKNAKHHFADTGVAAALRNLAPQSFDLDANPTALGGLLESFVFAELLRSAPYLSAGIRFYHWRDARGREIDILAESGNDLVAIEVKASTSVSGRDFKHLDWFSNEGPGKTRSVTAIIFYLGSERLRFGERRYVLPVSCLWGGSTVTVPLGRGGRVDSTG